MTSVTPCLPCACARREPADDRAPAPNSEVQTNERHTHLASDWLKESVVRISESISESIAEDIRTGYPGLKTETLGEARGATIDEEQVIVTPLLPPRLCSRPSRAA